MLRDALACRSVIYLYRQIEMWMVFHKGLLEEKLGGQMFILTSDLVYCVWGNQWFSYNYPQRIMATKILARCLGEGLVNHTFKDVFFLGGGGETKLKTKKHTGLWNRLAWLWPNLNMGSDIHYFLNPTPSEFATKMFWVKRSWGDDLQKCLGWALEKFKYIISKKAKVKPWRWTFFNDPHLSTTKVDTIVIVKSLPKHIMCWRAGQLECSTQKDPPCPPWMHCLSFFSQRVWLLCWIEGICLMSWPLWC